MESMVTLGIRAEEDNRSAHNGASEQVVGLRLVPLLRQFTATSWHDNLGTDMAVFHRVRKHVRERSYR